MENTENTQPKKRKSQAPELVCKITGNSRMTTHDYLQAKANRLGVTVKYLIDNYITKHVCSQLRAGTPLHQINPESNLTDQQLVDLVKHNSKNRKGFTFVNGVYQVLDAPVQAPTPTENQEESEEETVEVEANSESEEEPTSTEYQTSQDIWAKMMAEEGEEEEEEETEEE